MKIDLMQLDFVDKRLATMAAALEAATGMELTITSLYRPGDAGVHGQIPLRGVDLRCRDAQLGQRLAEVINTAWQYDPARPNMQCALYHDVGKGAHLHLQVHPNTALRD